MKINQHIIQGFFISLILIITTNKITLSHFSKITPENLAFYFVFILSPFFILLGSIYPDSDIRKPWKIKTRNIFSLFFSLLKIILVYPLRWLVYYPSYWIIKSLMPDKFRYQIKNEHHNTTHTLIGIGTASLIIFTIANFLFFLLKKHTYSKDMFILGLIISISISIGFIIGCLIHFIQDAYSGNGNSKYGISPFQPFNETKFYGNYSSFFNMNSKDKIMSVLIFLLLLLIPWGSEYIYKMSSSVLIGTFIFIIFVISLLIIIFSAYGIEFDMRLHKKNYEKPLKKLFVITIVASILINLIMYIIFL